jgi:uncharacterized protein YkwD
MRRAALLLLSAILGCAAQTAGGPGAPAPPDTPRVTSPAGDEGAAPAAPTSAPAPSGLLSLREAEQYALALVNKDRAAHDLPPLKWDETAAIAGREHAHDMATGGFTGHIGSGGDVPEERYTRAGGAQIVMENAGCFGDGKPRVADPSAKFSAKSIEDVEKAFMAEVPPNDGHRRNILNARHNGAGIGLVVTRDLDIACMAQELVDDYGDYEPLPKKLKIGAKIHVAGALRAPATIAGVGISRVDFGHKRSAAELNRLHSYPIPAPYVTYFPKGYKTPIELLIDKAGFSIDVPVTQAGKPGLYGVSVWATFPGSKELVMISLRTIEVK